MTLEKDALANLRGKLQRGDSQRIAEQTGLSRNQVYNVLHGKSWNQRVIQAAVEVVKEREIEASRLSRVLTNL